MPAVTLRQVAHVRRFAQTDVARSERGREWLALLRTHWPELLRLFATNAALREQVDRALSVAAQLIDRQQTPRLAAVDDRSIRIAEGVLAAMEPRASAPLRQAMTRVRRDLHAARGRPLAEIIGRDVRS